MSFDKQNQELHGVSPLKAVLVAGGQGTRIRPLAGDLVPDRPGRREPRAVKRRPKPYSWLTQPRHQFIEIPHRNAYRQAN